MQEHTTDEPRARRHTQAPAVHAPEDAAPAEGPPLRLAEFATLAEAMDYAAQSPNALSFHNARGEREHRLRYAELRDRALRLAAGLEAHGPRRGEPVGIVAEMHPDFVATFFACQYAGRVPAPLPVLTGLGGRHGYEQQIARILETSGIRAVIGPADSHETIARAAAELPGPTICSADGLGEGRRPETPEAPLGPGELSHIQFSSGSTRFPLGVEIGQDALMANARAIVRDALGLNEDDHVVSWLPFYHDMGLVGQCLAPIACQRGIDYLYTDAFARRPLQWLNLISKTGATISFGPDFGYSRCTRFARKRPDPELDLSRWRVAGVGGDMIKPEALEQFARAFAGSGFDASAFVPSYGLAECTLAVSFQPLGRGPSSDSVDKSALLDRGEALPPREGANGDAPPTRRFASCGAPLPGHAVEIRRGGSSALPERQVGEIFVSGPSVMRGYHNDPEATRQAMPDRTGWLNTGDMGYMAGGMLYVTGRSKELIIVKGRNIWPQDLEWYAEREIASLRSGDTAAFGYAADDGEEGAVLLAHCRSSDADERLELEKAIHAAVFRNTGIACRVELVPPGSLPYTTSGKLIRGKAKEWWLENRFAPS